VRFLALGFQLASSLDPFPGGRDSQENALFRDAPLFVERQQVVGVLHDGLAVSGSPGVDFGRHSPRNALGKESADIGEGRVDSVSFGRRVRESALYGDLSEVFFRG